MASWSAECCSEDWLIPELANLDYHSASTALFPACWEWSAGWCCQGSFPELVLWLCLAWYPESRSLGSEWRYPVSARLFPALFASFPVESCPESSVRELKLTDLPSTRWSVQRSNRRQVQRFLHQLILPSQSAVLPSEQRGRCDYERLVWRTALTRIGRQPWWRWSR